MLDAVNTYLERMRGRWSIQTTEKYRWYLTKFCEWVKGNDLPQDPELIEMDHIRRWLDANSRWGANSMRTGITAIRGFFRWAVGSEASPAKDVIAPKHEEKPQRTLEEWQIEKILATQDTSRLLGVRNVAIILLMLDTGLRAAEVCSVSVEHLDLDNRHLRVRIKGGQWGVAVFSDYTALQLAEWLRYRSLVAAREEQAVFVGVKGAKPGTHMTRDGLRAVFRSIGKKAGFHFSPHDLRRTFATMAVRNGAPTRLVQIAGRWKHLDMVETYTQALKPEDFEQYSPVKSLMGMNESQSKSHD